MSNGRNLGQLLRAGTDIAKESLDSGTKTYLSGSLDTSIIPDTDIAYDLGDSAHRFRDLYLSNSTLYLGNAAISATDSGDISVPSLQVGTTKISATDSGQISIPSLKIGDNVLSQEKVIDFDPEIEMENMEMGVDAPMSGHGHDWFWSWDVTSNLPYARTQIRSQIQSTVPLYKGSSYTIYNFAAHELHGGMSQTHKFNLKWIDGPGNDNLVDWSISTLNVQNISFLDMNDGQPTEVQRLNITVPTDIVLPELTAPNVTYEVSVADGSMSEFTFGAGSHSSAVHGTNPDVGPIRRGGTYTFDLDSSLSGHPFYLTTDDGSNYVSGQYVDEYTLGVTGSRNDTGQLVFTVPSSAPDTLYYQCGNHAAMRGEISVKDLAVEVNEAGEYVIYGQHDQQGHKVPINLRDKPALGSNMVMTFDGNKWLPQDLNVYIQKTNIVQDVIKDLADTKITEKVDAGTLVTPTVAKDITTYVINLAQQGDLQVHEGTARWHAPFDVEMVSIKSRLNTAADANVNITIQVNDSDTLDFAIPASSTSHTFAGDSDQITLSEGDYLTVDVNTVGNTAKGTDLNIQFKYKSL